jgi:hypothetical protein
MCLVCPNALLDSSRTQSLGHIAYSSSFNMQRISGLVWLLYSPAGSDGADLWLDLAGLNILTHVICVNWWSSPPQALYVRARSSSQFLILMLGGRRATLGPNPRGNSPSNPEHAALLPR